MHHEAGLPVLPTAEWVVKHAKHVHIDEAGAS
jgi:hypothetical protein